MYEASKFEYSFGIRRIHLPLTLVGGAPFCVYLFILAYDLFPNGLYMMFSLIALFVSFTYLRLLFDMAVRIPVTFQLVEDRLKCIYFFGNIREVRLQEIVSVLRKPRSFWVGLYEIEIRTIGSDLPIGIANNLPDLKGMIRIVKSRHPECLISENLLS